MDKTFSVGGYIKEPTKQTASLTGFLASADEMSVQDILNMISILMHQGSAPMFRVGFVKIQHEKNPHPTTHPAFIIRSSHIRGKKAKPSFQYDVVIDFEEMDPKSELSTMKALNQLVGIMIHGQHGTLQNPSKKDASYLSRIKAESKQQKDQSREMVADSKKMLEQAIRNLEVAKGKRKG